MRRMYRTGPVGRPRVLGLARRLASRPFARLQPRAPGLLPGDDRAALALSVRPALALASPLESEAGSGRGAMRGMRGLVALALLAGALGDASRVGSRAVGGGPEPPLHRDVRREREGRAEGAPAVRAGAGAPPGGVAGGARRHRPAGDHPGRAGRGCSSRAAPRVLGEERGLAPRRRLRRRAGPGLGRPAQRRGAVPGGGRHLGQPVPHRLPRVRAPRPPPQLRVAAGLAGRGPRGVLGEHDHRG